MISEEYIGKEININILNNLKSRQWIELNAEKIYKNKVNIVASLKLNLDGTIKNYVIKYFGWRNKISYMLSPFMRSRAKKTYDNSLLLLENGVNVPKPIAVYTERKLGFIMTNFIIMEEIENYRLARSVLRDISVNFEDKIKIVKKIAEFVKTIHNMGFTHNDLTLGNFLIDSNGKVFIVDLNRMKRKVFLSSYFRMYDISKLNLCNCRLEYEHDNCLYREFLKEYSIQPEKDVGKLQKAIKNNLLRHNTKRFFRQYRR